MCSVNKNGLLLTLIACLGLMNVCCISATRTIESISISLHYEPTTTTSLLHRGSRLTFNHPHRELQSGSHSTTNTTQSNTNTTITNSTSSAHDRHQHPPEERHTTHHTTAPPSRTPAAAPAPALGGQNSTTGGQQNGNRTNGNNSGGGTISSSQSGNFGAGPSMAVAVAGSLLLVGTIIVGRRRVSNSDTVNNGNDPAQDMLDEQELTTIMGGEGEGGNATARTVTYQDTMSATASTLPSPALADAPESSYFV